MSKNFKRGFTLIEVIITVAILAILCAGVYGVFTSIYNGTTYYRNRVTVSALADQYLEIARNLSYAQVGTLNGNPHGNLPDEPEALLLSFNDVNYKAYYAVSYVDDSADGTIVAGTDVAPNDYKQIKLYIKNETNGELNSFMTNIVPKNLEGLESGGALAIKVFDAVGQPVSGATIHITNTTLNPAINLTRTSDANGNWVEVGLPNSGNNYHIVVTKNGYSTDQTYPSTKENPNPIKEDATISNGEVTNISFAIDKLSNLTFATLNQSCQPISGATLGVRGSKLIGTPDVFKFDNVYTSNSVGQIVIPNIEWDSYTPSLGGSSYMIYGSSPIQQASILPDTSQNFNLILGPKTADSLLIIVKDNSTGNPVEGASVNLRAINGSSDESKITGGSVVSQQNWSGGSGQENFENINEYFSDDGNISNNEIPSGLRLPKNGSNYVSSGMLVSSTFDTGTDQTVYTTLAWQPTSQDPLTTIKFQIASNNDKETWTYLGPDGTGDSYYTVPGDTINASNNYKRYIRYKVFLSTANSSKTPVLTSVNINYVSDCFSPGQAIFPGLFSNLKYQATISMAGYQTQVIKNLKVNDYQLLQILLEH